VFSYGSSLRSAAAADTLDRVRKLAPELGIVRVTEVTWLDRVGVPVFVSIRPTAPVICVCAGKGLTAAEAKVGAYMEALEMAWSEVGRSTLAIEKRTGRAVLDANRDPGSFLSLCPIWGQAIDLDAPLLCTPMQPLDGGPSVYVPSELVFFPLPTELGGMRYFGSTTNGLASGNTVLEATVHALTEVIERDVTSFHNVDDHAVRVRPETLPAPLAELAARMDRAGLGLIVRALPNAFGVPVFTAITFDRSQPWVTLRGDGCHPTRSIAATRAVSETLQCRLSLIHGGRDDLTNVYKAFPNLSNDEKAKIYEADLQALLDGESVAYDDVLDALPEPRDLDECLRILCERVGAAGFPRILRAVYTPEDYPVQVVRIIVPGLECYSRDARRIGPRLRRVLRRGAAVEAAR